MKVVQRDEMMVIFTTEMVEIVIEHQLKIIGYVQVDLKHLKMNEHIVIQLLAGIQTMNIILKFVLLFEEIVKIKETKHEKMETQLMVTDETITVLL